jgi:hypothetical protein
MLALCGLVDALIASIYFIMQGTGGPVTFHSWNGTIVLAGKLALAGGVLAIAAGIWGNPARKGWLLIQHGCGLGALGVIQFDLAARFPISFLTIALLIIVMALSAGILDLAVARELPGNRLRDRSLLTLAGVASIGLVPAFLALGLHWVEVKPGSHRDLLWLGLYFAVSAISMLSLAAGLPRGQFPAESHVAEPR